MWKKINQYVEKRRFVVYPFKLSVSSLNEINHFNIRLHRVHESDDLRRKEDIISSSKTRVRLPKSRRCVIQITRGANIFRSVSITYPPFRPILNLSNFTFRKMKRSPKTPERNQDGDENGSTPSENTNVWLILLILGLVFIGVSLVIRAGPSQPTLGGRSEIFWTKKSNFTIFRGV